MQFRKGDKVRFLNEKGEGVVTRVLGGGQVMVEVEDGFEFPFLASQLVPAQPIDPLRGLTKKKEEPQAEAVQAQTVSTPEQFHQRFPDGVYFAGIPQNQHFPSAGKIETALFNHSDYDLYYTVSLKNGSLYDCLQAGTIGPRRHVAIETLTPQELDQWGQVKIDLIFFSEEGYEHRAPVSDMIRLKGVKFFKDTTYNDELLAGRKAWVTPVAPLEPVAESSTEPLTAADIRRMLEEKEKAAPKTKSSTPHLKHQLLEKEIDLHIEELLDNWNGLTNGQLLDIQLRRVQQEMDEALAQHLRKVIFIHGVGNGRLKNEVRRLLGTYKGIRIHDGSYQRYGFGATEVEFIR